MVLKNGFYVGGWTTFMMAIGTQMSHSRQPRDLLKNRHSDSPKAKFNLLFLGRMLKKTRC
jgi:hypothetical protein